MNTEIGTVSGDNELDLKSIYAKSTIKALNSMSLLEDLFIDGSEYDLSLIQPVISRCTGKSNNFRKFYGNSRRI